MKKKLSKVRQERQRRKKNKRGLRNKERGKKKRHIGIEKQWVIMTKIQTLKTQRV